MLTALLVAAFVELQGPGGQVIWLNVDRVTNFRRPRGLDQGHFAPGTQCIVFTVDGKHFATSQSCDELRALIERVSKR